MDYLIDIVLIFCCVAIIYQDFKSRSIHWFWLPIILVALLIHHYNNDNLGFMLTDFLANSSILIANGIAITLYFSVKNKKLINPVDSLIGLGDILLFFVLAMAFTVPTFVLFFIGSLILALSTTIFSLFRNSQQQSTIPLAAYTCIVFVLFQVLNRLSDPFYDFTNGHWMLTL